ncbi:MAG: PH domain-containing protein [bacterium]
MPPVVLKPRTTQRTLWLIKWGVVTLLVLLPFLMPLFGKLGPAMAQMLLALCVLWLVVALPIGVWIVLYHRSLVAEIMAEEVRLSKGVLTKKRITVPIAQIASVDVSSGLLERIFRLQRLRIFTSESGGSNRPALVLHGLNDAESLGDMILGGIPDFEETLRSAGTRGKHNDHALLEQILAEVRELRREWNRK